MTTHGEINPSGIDLLFGTSLDALEIANGLLTRRSGDVWIDTGDGNGILAGSGATDGVNRVDQAGNQLPLVDTSAIDKAAQDAQAKADAAAAKADQVRSDLQTEVDKVKSNVSDVDAKAEQARADAASASDASALKAVSHGPTPRPPPRRPTRTRATWTRASRRWTRRCPVFPTRATRWPARSPTSPAR